MSSTAVPSACAAPGPRLYSARAKPKPSPSWSSNAKRGLLIVDAALSPVQQKGLEDVTKAKVIDRTGLILEIFGERAATAEGAVAGRAGAS
jgi:GTP-binding protein HflX